MSSWEQQAAESMDKIFKRLADELLYDMVYGDNPAEYLIAWLKGEVDNDKDSK